MGRDGVDGVPIAQSLAGQRMEAFRRNPVTILELE
jgi:hypothetical protein